MSSSKIDIDRLELEIVRRLNLFRDATIDVVEYAVQQTAQDTVRETKDNARTAGIRGRKYIPSWSYKRDPNLKGKYKFDLVVYNKKHYQLTHLLEYGHDVKRKKGGPTLGSAPAFEHIAPAAQRAERLLEQYILAGIAQNRK